MPEELSEAVEIAHQEVLSELERFLGHRPEKLVLHFADNLASKHNELGNYRYCDNSIILERRLCCWEDAYSLGKDMYYGYLEDKLLHEAQGVNFTLRDWFKEVLTHEYLHRRFNEWYTYTNRSIILSKRELTRKLTPEEEKDFSAAMMGVSEAFAFWGVDRITGHKHLYEENANDYLIRLNNDDFAIFDSRTLKFFYDYLHRLSDKIADEIGNSFVIGYLVYAVRDNLPVTADVHLESCNERLLNILNTRYRDCYKQLKWQAPAQLDA